MKLLCGLMALACAPVALAGNGAAIPKEPILFSKYATALIGHGAPIVLPPVSQEVDYEAELVIIVGKRGKNIPAASALLAEPAASVRRGRSAAT